MKTATTQKDSKVPRNGKKPGQVDINTPAAEAPVKLIKPVQLEVEQITLTLRGLSPLVVHAWSEKAKKMMLDKQMGEASPGRQKKNPVEDFKQSLYRRVDGKGFCIPACSLKNAAVTAASMMELKMTDMRKAFHVIGDEIGINAPPIVEPFTEEDSMYHDQIKYEHQHGASMRSDMVRVGMGNSDVRFRAQFPVTKDHFWTVTFDVQYNARAITPNQLVSLFNNAGFGVGIFEYRPEKDGSWGRFEVAQLD